jgi:N-methylhydantoinase A/oxoprolinase/acetone carboxylase beta subunit
MWKLAVDIGGTFTDVVMVDEETGELFGSKYPTTAQDPSIGFTRGVDTLFDEKKLVFDDVSQIVHASTLATNTLLERKKEGDTALITTKGFRDVLEIQRERRYDLYDIFIEKPKPVIPRHYIREIDERIAFDGTIIKTMDEKETRSIVAELIKKGIQSIAVSLLHSYVNPSHEKRIGAIVKEMSPGAMFSLSHEVIPHIGEYERTNTTAINAYVMPETRIYLEKLTRGLNRKELSKGIYIMKSNGGITTVEDMIHFPVHMIEAGPAAGALMAAFYGNEVFDCQNLLSFDMGGTTAKLALIEDGRPRVSNWFEADKVKMKEGSGLPIIVPAVDLIEIGAGGGSIAAAKMGIIAVGPESAGAEPGPACYGKGGLEPTVTDADLVLGYLNPDYFLGGKVRLDREGACRSIETKIAKPLGLDVTTAAWGIHEMVNKNMASAFLVEQGRPMA